MFKEETQNGMRISSAPIIKKSGLTDGLIRGRESLLNRFSGVSPALALNAQTAEELTPPSADVAARLKSVLTDLKASVLDASGAGVNYAALRHNPDYAAYRQECLTALRQFDPHSLSSEEAARAFWINLYNALVLDAVIYFDVQESVTKGFLGILTFFRRAAYLVGGQRVSLEDMEHGILRGNRGNPYVPGVSFPSSDPRLAWALPVDPRIHFALNCGGRSCPPIRAYTPEKLDQQLDLAARGFVDATIEVRPERNEVILSQIFRWFRADFGGREGIARFLIHHLPDDERRRLLLSAGEDLRFIYTPYDWRLNGI